MKHGAKWQVGLAIGLASFLGLSLAGCQKGGQESPGAPVNEGTSRAAKLDTTAHRVMVSVPGNSRLSAAQLDYVIKMQDKIKENWRPIESDKQYSVGCEYSVTRPGYLMEVHPITATAKNRAIEKSLDTVRMQAPYGVMPEEFGEGPVTFRCDFVYLPK